MVGLRRFLACVNRFRRSHGGDGGGGRLHVHAILDGLPSGVYDVASGFPSAPSSVESDE